MVLFQDANDSAFVNNFQIFSGDARMSIATEVWRLKNLLLVVALPSGGEFEVFIGLPCAFSVNSRV